MKTRSRKKIFTFVYDFNIDGYDSLEITATSEHIAGEQFSTLGEQVNIALGPVGVTRRPDPRCYFVRSDGQLICLTYFQSEKVIGFTRFVTDGKFVAVTAIPQTGGLPDQVWAIVERFSATKRFVEVFDSEANEFLNERSWLSLQTDCAKVYDVNGTSTTVFAGLSHLEGRQVRCVGDGADLGLKTVAGGQITLADPVSRSMEIGLDYVSTLETMRPAIEGQMIEGIPRSWIKLWLRLKSSFGGKLNDEPLQYTPPIDFIAPGRLFTGDKDVTSDKGFDTDGSVKFVQDQPYPMMILCMFGELDLGDHG